MTTQTTLGIHNATSWRLTPQPRQLSSHFRFVDLPAELRNVIYAFVISEPRIMEIKDLSRFCPLASVCQQTRHEALPMFLERNWFRLCDSSDAFKWARAAVCKGLPMVNFPSVLEFTRSIEERPSYEVKFDHFTSGFLMTWALCLDDERTSIELVLMDYTAQVVRPEADLQAFLDRYKLRKSFDFYDLVEIARFVCTEPPELPMFDHDTDIGAQQHLEDQVVATIDACVDEGVDAKWYQIDGARVRKW